MPKITDTACKNALPDAKVWDSEIKGFALFAGKTRKTFFFQRDVNGKTVRDKIGIWGRSTQHRPALRRHYLQPTTHQAQSLSAFVPPARQR